MKTNNFANRDARLSSAVRSCEAVYRRLEKPLEAAANKGDFYLPRPTAWTGDGNRVWSFRNY